MTKRILSKYSVCKKLKGPYKNLWGLEKKDLCHSVLNRKKKKLTAFGRLLDFKQSFKLFYSNLNERTFKRSIKFYLRSPSKTLDKLTSSTESRLDSVIFRSCFAVSFHEARQLINHRFITVNNICTTSVNKKLNKGDIIRVQNCSISKKTFLSALTTRSIPNYLELDLKNFTIIFLWDTNFKNTYYPIKTRYSSITRYYK